MCVCALFTKGRIIELVHTLHINSGKKIVDMGFDIELSVLPNPQARNLIFNTINHFTNNHYLKTAFYVQGGDAVNVINLRKTSPFNSPS